MVNATFEYSIALREFSIVEDQDFITKNYDGEKFSMTFSKSGNFDLEFQMVKIDGTKITLACQVSVS